MTTDNAFHRDDRFPWPAVVVRDSLRLTRAVERITTAPDVTPEDAARRLGRLQDEGVLSIDCELTPGTEVHVVRQEVLRKEDLVLVWVRYWCPRLNANLVDSFPLTCLGERRTRGSRRRKHPQAWKEAPWLTRRGRASRSTPVRSG